MIEMINTVGVPLSTGFIAWFTPREDITTYELALILILFSGKRGLEDLRETFEKINRTAPLIIRHFTMKLPK